ncbi:MAG: c-type cytochrome domain-containing protein [Gemmataceae bacterium]
MKKLGTIVATLLLASLPARAVDLKDLPPLDNVRADKISYKDDVWPILKRHCWGCHSSAKPKGKLSLDSMADMLKGGSSGPLFKPGKPDDSELIKVLLGPEPSMPQKQPPLTADKIQLLRLWVLAGAKNDMPPTKVETVVKAPATYTFAPAITSVALSDDGKLAACACRSEVVLVDVDGYNPPRRIATQSDLVAHVEFSPDGKLLAAAGGTPGQYGLVQFFNPANGQLVGQRRLGKDTFFRGNFAPDGKNIALGGADGAVHIIPIDEKQPVRRFDLHTDWVFDVAYTPDGKMLVTGGRDKATKLASAETGELLRPLDTSPEIIHAVVADENFGLSSGRARTFNAYEFKIALQGIQVTGAGNGARPILRKEQYTKGLEGQPGEVFDLAVSGDRKLVAVGGTGPDVRIYTIANRQRSGLIAKVPAPIYALALNKDGSRLALGSKSGELQIYELPSGKQLKALVPVPVAPAAGVVGK